MTKNDKYWEHHKKLLEMWKKAADELTIRDLESLGLLGAITQEVSK